MSISRTDFNDLFVTRRPSDPAKTQRLTTSPTPQRVPPETHRALAMRAAEEGVSLNRLVSARLANDA